MATLTIRNLETKTVQELKELAAENGRSMEQEVRALIGAALGERCEVLDEIEAAVARQARRPTAEEVDAWIAVGRP